MNERSKRYQLAAKLVEPGKAYKLAEALELVKKTSSAKFDASVEVHLRLGIDPKQTDQNLRTAVTLPHGTGKKKIIAAFVTSVREKEALDAGADIVGGEEMIKELKKTEKINFDVAVAEPAMMKNLAAVAKILGTKGKMPSPKTGTVSIDVAKAIKEIAGGKIEVKNDETGNLHQIIGKVSFDTPKLEENFKTLMATIKSNKPKGAKQDYIRAIYICSSMGPSIKVSS